MDLKTTALGIELGSTRIKAVLIDKDHMPVAQGDFEWENQFENGIWTYSSDMIHSGIQACYKALKADARSDCSHALGRIGAESLLHLYKRLFHDSLYRSFPSCVDGRDNALHGIVQKHGDAVRRPDADGHARQPGHEGVVPFQFFPRQPRRVNDGHLAVMDLMPLYDRIRERGIPPRRERLHTGTQAIFQQTVEHSGQQ